MRRIIFFLTIILLLLSFCACSNKNTNTEAYIESQKEYDIENDIEFIKNIFACENEKILSQMCGQEIASLDEVQIEGTFADIKGTYEIEFYGENEEGYEADNIYSIKFSWDCDQEIFLEEIVNSLCKCIGEYEDNFDKEWGYYCWSGRDTTKFSDESFANCFDIQIFGDDCYIRIGLSTTV